MDMLSYDVPCAYFPRMDYAQRNSLDIYNNYKDFIGGFVMKVDEIKTYDHVSIHICKTQADRTFPVGIGDLAREGDGLVPVQTTFESIDSYFDQRLEQVNTLSVYFLDACKWNETCQIQKDSCLFVLLTSEQTDKNKNKNDMIFSTKDYVRTDTCNLLENFLLKPMKKMFEFLYSLKHSSLDRTADEENQSMETKTANKKIIPKRDVESDSFENDEQGMESKHAETTHPHATMYKHLINVENAEETGYMSNGMKRAGSSKQPLIRKKCRNVKHLQESARHGIGFLERVDREKIDGLLKSMLALYAMTNIPDDQQPHFIDHQPKRLSEKLSKDLFSLSRSITGMGYRSEILIIFMSEDGKDANIVKNQVETHLKHEDIVYEIVQVSTEIHNLMHVGDKLEPVPGYGTLGCFAKMGDASTCILLSKHVANHGREFYFEDKRKVCKVLPATLKDEPGDLDIAAAEIFHEEHVCSSLLRDSTGKQMKSKLHEYVGEDKLLTEGRKVQFWGASSKPGKGLIEIAEFKIGNKNCQQILIQIKDDNGKFAEPGDSGAIVCADDPDGDFVHAIGMVIGDGIGQNGRVYYVLPLSNGLKQLQRKTGRKFELY